MLTKWPTTLVDLAIQNTEVDPTVKAETLSLLKDIDQTIQKEPFGHQKHLVKTARELAGRLDLLATSLQRKPFKVEMGKQLLKDILETGQNSELDYDSARRIVWAFRVVYEEIHGRPTSEQEWYNQKTPDQLVGWYSDEKLNLVETILKSFEDYLILDLQKGQMFAKLPSEPQGGYFKWSPERVLDPLMNY